MIKSVYWMLTAIVLYSCSSTRFSPDKKYSQHALQQDYDLLRGLLEKKHPSIYWYTPKDSMQVYFKFYRNCIKDSMTEQQFAWQIIMPLLHHIRCGHTSVSMSKGYKKWIKNKKIQSFPLFMKIWNDSMVVTANLNRNDSIFKRGVVIHAVNGLTSSALTDKMFSYLAEDGYSKNINYIRLSSNFPYYHRNIFGNFNTYDIIYSDSSKQLKQFTLPAYQPMADSSYKKNGTKNIQSEKTKIKAKDKLSSYRSLITDSSGYAILTLNTFNKGKLRSFFRKSFKKIRKNNIQNLVIDIRNNSGGKLSLSTLLTRYVTTEPFKVADSIWAVSQNLRPYTLFFKGGFLNSIQLMLMTKKEKDELYHLRQLERKLFKPKKTNHYNGQLYVITGGPTFSAASLFANEMKGQKHVTIVGEETGGGWYGNNGIMLPSVKLPHTKIKVIVPLFRLVQYQHIPWKGTGVIPDIYVGPDYDAIVKGYDKKLKIVRQLISNTNSKNHTNSYRRVDGVPVPSK